LSKINELRKKAVEAARKRDWSGAVKLYERVCEIDTNNPGFRVELGDIFIKLGQVDQALLAFEKAAEAYRTIGLHNNAIAVYKKILRLDAKNLDALWGLGEVKEQQGLEADAAAHYVDFLARHQDVSTSVRQAFVNRCLLLIERYDDDLQMLSRIEKIFERWHLGEDHARVLIQKARLARSDGQDELIEKYVARAREVFEELDLLDDYVQLRREMQGEAPAEDEVEVPEPIVPEVELPEAAIEVPESRSRSAELDLGFDLDPGLDFGSREMAADPPRPKPEPAASADVRIEPTRLQAPSATPPAPAPQRRASDAPPPAPAAPPSNADLLDALLSDSRFDVRADESGQVETIEADVGAQIAGQIAADDFQGQYDVAIVYLDMGLYESAIDAFERAARGAEQRLKALEMRGNALRQLGRNADALAAYQEGLHTLGHPARAYLGLLYETGACLVELGQIDDALHHFEQAAAIDAEFLDVRERVRQLSATSPR
jgi:tetratricopeptide (TPR) repeat protein